jgi:hypothetical protein
MRPALEIKKVCGSCFHSEASAGKKRSESIPSIPDLKKVHDFQKKRRYRGRPLELPDNNAVGLSAFAGNRECGTKRKVSGRRRDSGCSR